MIHPPASTEYQNKFTEEIWLRDIRETTNLLNPVVGPTVCLYHLHIFDQGYPVIKTWATVLFWHLSSISGTWLWNLDEKQHLKSTFLERMDAFIWHHLLLNGWLSSSRISKLWGVIAARNQWQGVFHGFPIWSCCLLPYPSTLVQQVSSYHILTFVPKMHNTCIARTWGTINLSIQSYSITDFVMVTL